MGSAAVATPVFVARQPVFDGDKEVFGYELLFRASQENRYQGVDGDASTLDVIANSLMDIGLDELTGGRRGFINFTRSLLVGNVVDLLPPRQVAIEILESVTPDEEVLAACRRLKDAGYVLVLDDFVLADGSSPLLDLADIVKVDFLHASPDERVRVAAELNRRHIKALAEKVETEEDFRQAVAAGYSYFQGYFFCKPVIHEGKSIPVNKLAHLRMMQEINRAELSYDDLEGIIKHDVSLTYRLLRFINSAWFGLRYEIKSVKHALVWLGPKEIRKWFYLVSLRDLGSDKPNEVFLRAMTRAKMGEGVASPVGLQQHASELFLMGMFSLIDVLLDVPLSHVLEKLPLDGQVKSALLGTPGAYRDVHDMITCYERGDWDAFSGHAGCLSLDTGAVPRIFKQSVKWANQAFASVKD